jgi:hypothetical protein
MEAVLLTKAGGKTPLKNPLGPMIQLQVHLQLPCYDFSFL